MSMITSESSRRALRAHRHVVKVHHRPRLFTLPLIDGFCYFFSLLAHRRVGGAQADFSVYTAEGTDWPQATL